MKEYTTGPHNPSGYAPGRSPTARLARAAGVPTYPDALLSCAWCDGPRSASRWLVLAQGTRRPVVLPVCWEHRGELVTSGDVLADAPYPGPRPAPADHAQGRLPL